MNEIFKALADPGRRRLLDSLNAYNGQSLGDLCRELDMSRQAVSKHLAMLEAANLVIPIRRGREKLHYLNADPINAISERWIDNYEKRDAGEHQQRVAVDPQDAARDRGVPVRRARGSASPKAA